jgi:hypothetical protein
MVETMRRRSAEERIERLAPGVLKEQHGPPVFAHKRQRPPESIAGTRSPSAPPRPVRQRRAGAEQPIRVFGRRFASYTNVASLKNDALTRVMVGV